MKRANKPEMHFMLNLSCLSVCCMERHQRITKAINASGKQKQQIAKECGVSNASVSQWLSGDSKSLRPENLYALAKATGFCAMWLAIGEGPEKPEDAEDNAPSSDDYALIQQFSAKAAAGNGYHNDHVEVREGLVFKRSWLRRSGVKAESLCVIYAEGSSMEPTISDGDVLLIDGSDRFARSGRVYAFVRPDGSVSVKRLIQQVAGDWIIRSDNQDKARYPDETIKPDDLAHINIIGRSVWRGGGL